MSKLDPKSRKAQLRRWRQNIREPFWNKRKIRFLVGIGIVLWIIVAYEISPYSYGRFLWPYQQYWDLYNAKENFPPAPPITYNANITFDTVSDYSVGVPNPIHAVVIIYDVNRTDFDSFYGNIYFVYSAFRGNYPSLNQLPPAPVANNLEQLSKVRDGVWKGETDIVFFHDWINFTGPVLLPIYWANQAINGTLLNQLMAPQVKAFHMSIKLQPQTFTDQLLMNEVDAKYAAMGSAVSLVFLLPIFEGVLVRKKGQKKSTDKEDKSDQSEVRSKGQGENKSDGQPRNENDTRNDGEEIPQSTSPQLQRGPHEGLWREDRKRTNPE